MHTNVEMTDDGIVRLKQPEIMPWVPLERLVCPACGTKAPAGLARFARMLRGKQPLTAWAVAYCAGSMPPTEEKSLNTPFGPISGERQNTCAGVERAHLHLQCARCGMKFLMHPAR